MIEKKNFTQLQYYVLLIIIKYSYFDWLWYCRLHAFGFCVKPLA